MLHIVDGENQDLYQPQLEEHFRLRHRVFVEQRGWEELRQPDGREIDQFDTDDATHLLFLDEDRGVLGGSRLTPSTKPNLLADVFPQLASFKPIPRGANISDWTRYYVNPAARGERAYSTIPAKIQSGIIEYCLEQGIDQLTAIIDPTWIVRFLRFGLEPQALGLPIVYKGESIVAVTLSPSEEALYKTRRLHENEAVFLVRH